MRPSASPHVRRQLGDAVRHGSALCTHSPLPALPPRVGEGEGRGAAGRRVRHPRPGRPRAVERRPAETGSGVITGAASKPTTPSTASRTLATVALSSSVAVSSTEPSAGRHCRRSSLALAVRNFVEGVDQPPGQLAVQRAVARLAQQPPRQFDGLARPLAAQRLQRLLALPVERLAGLLARRCTACSASANISRRSASACSRALWTVCWACRCRLRQLPRQSAAQLPPPRLAPSPRRPAPWRRPRAAGRWPRAAGGRAGGAGRRPAPRSSAPRTGMSRC